MQYLTSRNMSSSIATPKIHKMNTDTTPWMPSDQYFNNDSDTDTNLYLQNSNSHKSRTSSTTDMCVEKNTEGKPPYSYATLIKYAIERSSENKLTLSQIYQWVIDHYPYYGSAGSGWKNSIRHNLSLNKSFVRVPRPVNEPGKGSYWTVDQYAVDTEQRVRTSVRGRSSRSSSDTSLHHRNNDPWLMGRSRDGRSLSTDASGPSSAVSAAPVRRVSTSRFGYCGHPYGGYGDNFNQQYGYPNYHYQQRMPSHETLLTARQHSSVTYSLPATATTTNQTPLNNFSNTNTMYSMQQPFYSHRQSCPDLTNTFPETNMLPNFNTAGSNHQGTTTASTATATTTTTATTAANNTSTSDATMLESKMLYSQPFYTVDSSSPIRQRAQQDGFSYLEKENVLPSPVLSSSTSPSSSSQHLSVVDPLSMVTQHPSPVTTTSAAASAATTSPGRHNNTNNNRLTSPYFSQNLISSKEECLTSPSSPLAMTGN